jgi:hypothetical protein
MKLTSSIAVVAILLASVAGGLGAEKPAGKANEAKSTKVAEPKKASANAQGKTERVALTGSYIKKDIRRNGIVTDGANPVVVLDQEMIRNSGAADLRQLLVLKGLSR